MYTPSPSYSGAFNFAKTIKPLWTTKFEDEVEFLDWAKAAIELLRDDQKAIAEKDLRNRDFYMGLQSIALGAEGIPRDKEGKPLEKFARVTINQIYEAVEQWKSKITRYAPAIAVIPSNDEYNDRMAAQLSKYFIDYLFYVNDIDDFLEGVASSCRIDGETYAFVYYDKSKGDIHPDAYAAQSLGLRIPLLNSSGEQVTGEDGEPLFIDKTSRTGDVAYEHVQRRFVFCQPKANWKDVEWIIKISSADSDELKAKYPEKADLIENKGRLSTMVDIFEPNEEFNEIIVFELYHKSTEFLDTGLYCKFTDSTVLEQKTMKEFCGHGDLPVVRLTNIDVPGILRGQSFIDQLLLLQVMYNNIASLAYTNIALGAHLYWMVPASANLDLKKIKNGNSVLKYMGGVPPTLQQFRTVGPELFQMADFVDKAIQRISGIQGVSRGEPPAGIEAGVALAFLEEQENQRANTDIKKHNAFIKKLARYSLATAGAFYDPSDGRTIRIVGKNNQFSIKALDVAKLGGAFDIRVQRTTALSESKAGRLSQILALEGRFPGMLSREQVLDMMDLANDQKFYSLASVAVRAAERENELMSEGQIVAGATQWEEHIVHWQSLVKFMQSSSFKEDIPMPIKQLFIEHGGSHEFWMHLQMGASPTFAEKIRVECPQFPIFTLPDMPMAIMGASAMGSMPGLAPESPMAPPVDNQMSEEPMDTGEGAGPGMGPTPPLPPTEQPDQMPTEQR